MQAMEILEKCRYNGATRLCKQLQSIDGWFGLILVALQSVRLLT